MANKQIELDSDQVRKDRSKLLAHRARNVLKAREEKGVVNQDLISKAREVASLRASSSGESQKGVIVSGKKLSKKQLIEQIKSNKAKVGA